MSCRPNVASLFVAALTRAGAVLSWPLRVAEARRVMTRMAGMSHHELRDIGLTPQDVRDATALPLSTDPGSLFRIRADERFATRSRRGCSVGSETPPVARRAEAGASRPAASLGSGARRTQPVTRPELVVPGWRASDVAGRSVSP